jgi:hypothetical protein
VAAGGLGGIEGHELQWLHAPSRGIGGAPRHIEVSCSCGEWSLSGNGTRAWAWQEFRWQHLEEIRSQPQAS